MSLPELSLEPTQAPQADRRFVAYFEHEFSGIVRRNPAAFVDIYEEHLGEIEDHNFNEIVLCITESDVADKRRQKMLGQFVTRAHVRGMRVLADPWRLGGLFGGEARSYFEESGQAACRCNPKFDALLSTWLHVAAETGTDGVFWDEPDIKCDDHSEQMSDFLDTYTQKARQLGLANSVCLCANERRKYMITEVATLPTVDDIGTDPYYPNAFAKIAPEDRLAYVAKWARRINEAAGQAGKDAHVWLQGFQIAAGDHAMMSDFAAVIRDAGINDIGFWGFRGCESVAELHTDTTAAPQTVWALAKTVFGQHRTTASTA